MNRRPAKLRNFPTWTAVALIILSGLMVASSSRADIKTPIYPGDLGEGGEPPTGGGSTAIPVFGGNVYQGLITVTSGEPGVALMEIGNAGKEIASTSSINLRPDYLTADKGLRIERDAATGRSNVHAPGGVCFNGTCYDTWPTGSGTSYWALVSGHLQPTTVSQTAQFSSSGTNYLSALELVANNADRALYVSNTYGANPTAAEFASGATINNDLLVDARPATGDEIILVEGGLSYPVWHSGNDGHDSGLDASKIDSYPFEFRITNNEGNSCDSHIRASYTNTNCFCADFGLWGGDIKCIGLQ